MALGMDDATRRKFFHACNLWASAYRSDREQGFLLLCGLAHIDSCARKAIAQNTQLVQDLINVAAKRKCTRQTAWAAKALSVLQHLLVQDDEAIVQRITNALDSAGLSHIRTKAPQLIMQPASPRPASDMLQTLEFQHLLWALSTAVKNKDNAVVKSTIAAIGALFHADRFPVVATSSICEDAFSALVDYVHIPAAREALLRSPLSLAQHLQVLQGYEADRLSCLRRSCAVVCLAEAIHTDDAKRCEIVCIEGGNGLIVGLKAELAQASKGAPGSPVVVSEEIFRMWFHALRTLMELEPDSHAQVTNLTQADNAATLAFTSALLERVSGTPSDVVFVLEWLVSSTAFRHIATTTGDAAFYVQCFDHGQRDEFLLQSLAALECNVLGAKVDKKTDEELAVFLASGVLATLLTLRGKSPRLRDAVVELLQSAGHLAPVLLASRRDRDNLLALEIMSRCVKNQKLAIWRGSGVAMLAAFLGERDGSLKSIPARILANLACNNRENRVLIVATGALISLVALLSSEDSEARTAAAMALRNIVGDVVSRHYVASIGGILPLVEMLKSERTPAEQIAAAGALGSLARENHVANQQAIFCSGGLLRLVELLRSEGVDNMTHKLKDTVTMTLYVLVKNNATSKGVLEATGGADDLKKLAQGREPSMWTVRLLDLFGEHETTTETRAAELLSCTRPTSSGSVDD